MSIGTEPDNRVQMLHFVDIIMVRERGLESDYSLIDFPREEFGVSRVRFRIHGGVVGREIPEMVIGPYQMSTPIPDAFNRTIRYALTLLVIGWSGT